MCSGHPRRVKLVSGEDRIVVFVDSQRHRMIHRNIRRLALPKSMSFLAVMICLLAAASPEKEYVLKLKSTTAVVHIPNAQVKYDIQMWTFYHERRGRRGGGEGGGYSSTDISFKGAGGMFPPVRDCSVCACVCVFFFYWGGVEMKLCCPPVVRRSYRTTDCGTGVAR